jgi:membrane-bound lytic murein transglycosylase D
VRATDAAVRMMRWLRGQFGSLFVAAAAYNGGPGRVSRGIAQLAATDAANDAASAAAAAVLAAFDTANASAASAGAPPAGSPRAVGDARFFALADAGVLRSETVNYVPQLIAAALVAKEADRHGVRVARRAPLAYDEVRVPALTPLAAVAKATGSPREALLDLNPHLLRGMTPPGGPTVVRVPEGAGDGAADALAALDADARRAFGRVVTRRRETWDALVERAEVPAAVLRAYNPGLETVERGKYRGRLVSNQAVRVPTAAVQAYARAQSWDGVAPGALPALPAPPPEPAATVATKTAPKAASKTAAKSGDTPAARPAPRATADSAARADSAVYRALRVAKEGSEGATPAAVPPARRRNTPEEARRTPTEPRPKPAKASAVKPAVKPAAKSAAKPAPKGGGKSATTPAVKPAKAKTSGGARG